MRARLLVLAACVASALAVAGAALGSDGGFSPAGPDSPNADRIQTTYWFVFGFAAAVFLLVEIALAVFIVRYRSRGRPREVEGPQVRGHLKLEIVWTAVPILILATIAAFVFSQLSGIDTTPNAGAAGSRLHVGVQGRQFYWQFTYPNGVIEINRLRVPVGRPVRLEVTSPDVNHSWWIPALGGKIDAIPGHPNHTWFELSKPSTYTARCAEFCGIQHAVMKATVEGVPAPQFDSWLADQARAQTDGTSDLGKQEFEGVCAVCHGPQGQGGIGPNLAGSAIARDHNALATLLENGGKLMPAVGRGWTQRQEQALFSYLDQHVTKPAASGG